VIALAAWAAWVGYSMVSYGWVLVMGYDVPVVPWLNPLDPYDWPADGNPGFVRKGQIFPGGPPGTASTTTTAGTSSGGKQTVKTATPNPRPPAIGGGGAGR
jgi:hypothetical protein